MKTTLEIPDELLRQAKAKAALEGRKLKDVVADALREAVRRVRVPAPLHKARFPLVKSKRPGVLTAAEVRKAEAAMEQRLDKHYAKFMRR